MPQKEIDFHPFITPYDWSYNHDDGMWYEDFKESMPQPKRNPKKSDFHINCFDGMLFLNDFNKNYSYFSIDANNPEDFFRCLFEKKDAIDSFTFSWIIEAGRQRALIAFGYTDTFETDMYSFIQKIEDNKDASIYIEEFSDIKIFVYNLKNNKIRIVMQEYYNDPLPILFDAVVDKQDFLKTIKETIKAVTSHFCMEVKFYAEKHCIEVKKLADILAKEYRYKITQKTLNNKQKRRKK